MVSFRQNQYAGELQNSLSARKLAANINTNVASATADDRDAASALK